MSPQNILPWVLGLALGVGGVMHGLHVASTSRVSDTQQLETQLRMAQEENEMIKRENETLRSLAQGGGELAVPRESIERVEKELGLRFIASPVVHRIANEALRERIAAAMESRLGPSGIEDRQAAYRMMGLIGQKDDLLAAYTLAYAMGARSWFDDQTGEGWVTDRYDGENIPDQAALMKVLARILLSQHYPRQVKYPGDDAYWAREAVHQGAACGVEGRFYASKMKTVGFMPLAEQAEVERVMASLPSFIQGVSQFPMMEGKALTDTKYVDGNEALQKLFRNMPETTREVMLCHDLLAKGVAHDEVKWPEEPYLEESIGQLGLRLWLEITGELELAIEIASAWKSDRYRLFPDGENGIALVWDIEVSDENASKKLEGLARQMRVAVAQAEPTQKEVVRLKTPDGGGMELIRLSPTQLRWLFTQTEAFATSLKPKAHGQ